MKVTIKKAHQRDEKRYGLGINLCIQDYWVDTSDTPKRGFSLEVQLLNYAIDWYVWERE